MINLSLILFNKISPQVNFEKEPRNHFIGLLGHDPHELSRKVALATGAPCGLTNGMPGAIDAEELAERMENLSTGSRGSEAKLGSGDGVASSVKGEWTVPFAFGWCTYNRVNKNSFWQSGIQAVHNLTFRQSSGKKVISLPWIFSFLFVKSSMSTSRNWESLVLT